MKHGGGIADEATKAAHSFALNTTKLVDATLNGTLELGTNTTRETLKTVDVAQSAANTLIQNTLQVSKSATNATAKLVDTVTVNSVKLTDSVLSNSTDIATSGLSNVSSVTKTGLNQVGNVTNAALEQSGAITTATINATGNAMVGVLNSVNNVVSKKVLETHAYGKGINSRNIEIQKKGIIQAIEMMFYENVNELKDNLNHYVKVQNKLIKQMLLLFKSNKCKKSFWGTNCEKQDMELMKNFETELEKITGFSNQNIIRLDSIHREVKGALFKLYSKMVTEETIFEVINKEGNLLLLPFYTKSSEIFQETLIGFEQLSVMMNTKIKDEIKGGKNKHLTYVSKHSTTSKRNASRRYPPKRKKSRTLRRMFRK